MFQPTKTSDLAASIIPRPTLVVGPDGPFDVATTLPPAAAGKLEALRIAADDARATLAPLHERIQEQRDGKFHAEARLRQLRESGLREVPDEAEEHPSVRQALQAIRNSQAEIAKLTAMQDERSATWAVAARLRERSETYAEKFGAACKPFVGTLKVPKASPVEIERIRAAVANLEADAHRTRSAPVPLAEAKRLLREEIEKMAADGAPSARHLLEGVSEIVWFSGSSSSRQFSGRGFEPAFTNAMKVIAWANRDSIIAALEAELDELADDGQAMTAAQRTEALADLAARKLEAERIEVELVDQLRVQHREDIDPRALLGVVGPPLTEEF